MQNVYEICFYGGLVLAILLLIAAIVLFVVLKIPKVIGELSGRTAKYALKEMQDGTAKPGSVAKKEQEKYYNMGSGKITAKETVSSKEERKNYGNDSTELLDNKKKKEKKFEETDVPRPGINDYETPDDGETEILGADNADETTDVLRNATSVGDDGATDVLRNDGDDDGTTDVLRNAEGVDGATDVLRGDDEDDGDATDVLRGDEDDSDATDVLRADDDEEGTSVLTTGTLEAKVKVVYNIVVVHSNESIETGR